MHPAILASFRRQKKLNKRFKFRCQSFQTKSKWTHVVQWTFVQIYWFHLFIIDYFKDNRDWRNTVCQLKYLMKHSSNKGQHTKDTSFIEERFHLKKKVFQYLTLKKLDKEFGIS